MSARAHGDGRGAAAHRVQSTTSAAPRKFDELTAAARAHASGVRAEMEAGIAAKEKELRKQGQVTAHAEAGAFKKPKPKPKRTPMGASAPQPASGAPVSAVQQLTDAARSKACPVRARQLLPLAQHTGRTLFYHWRGRSRGKRANEG